MTLEEAQKQGYEVLSGPYTRREEKMMLAAKDALDQNGTIRYKVLLTGFRWYILRQGMIEIPPESQAPDPPRERRVRLQVQVSASVQDLVRPIALRKFQGSLGLLVEEALIEKYASNNDKLKMEFRREVREVMKRLPKGVKK